MDYALVVVDGRYGIGNGHVLPGRPSRRLIDQVRFASGIVRMGEDKAGAAVVRQVARAENPIFDARMRRAGATSSPTGGFWPRRHRPPLTSSSIRWAQVGGGDCHVASSFPDHHFYTNDELRELVHTAGGGANWS